MVPSARSAATWFSGQCSQKGPRTRQSRRSPSLSRTNPPFLDPISTRTFMGGLPLLRPRRRLGSRVRQDRADLRNSAGDSRTTSTTCRRRRRTVEEQGGEDYAGVEPPTPLAAPRLTADGTSVAAGGSSPAMPTATARRGSPLLTTASGLPPNCRCRRRSLRSSGLSAAHDYVVTISYDSGAVRLSLLPKRRRCLGKSNFFFLGVPAALAAGPALDNDHPFVRLLDVGIEKASPSEGRRLAWPPIRW